MSLIRNQKVQICSVLGWENEKKMILTKMFIFREKTIAIYLMVLNFYEADFLTTSPQNTVDYEFLLDSVFMV